MRSASDGEAMINPGNEIAAPPPPKALLPEPVPAKRGAHVRQWIYAAIALALAAGLFLWFRAHDSPAAQKTAGGAKGGRGRGSGATPVVAVRAKTGNIGVYVTGLGAITPIYTVSLKSRVDGQLMSVHFQEGELVHQGDPLIDIDRRPYEAVVVQVEGELVRDQALLENARVDLTRYTTLLAQDAIPEQQLATQRALVTQYEGTVKNDQGLLDAAKLNVGYCHITAPITGIVGLRLVDPGNIVHATDANGMLVVTQIQPISVIFTVSEDQLPPVLQKFRAGRKLKVDAWDREMKSRIASGVLSTVDNEIDQTTGTLKLRALFDNTNRALYPNQFVNARLLEQEKTGVTLLPSAAIQRNTSDTYVYLVGSGNTVTIRKIGLGTTEGDQTEITSGLAPGDTVVLTGVDKLQEGGKVTVSLSGDAAPSAGPAR
ncbi:MAG: efflux RND transporter periplasmic adaptor subunit [Acidobacteriota bacterium]